VAIVLLLLYNLTSYNNSPNAQLLRSPASSSSSNSSLVQQLLDQLGKGPEGQLVQQHILSHTNISSLSAAQLPLLLQGTNFTTLSTAAVLDAAGGLSSQQKWQLANLHQRLFCA
jgi:hypothetical protein